MMWTKALLLGMSLLAAVYTQAQGTNSLLRQGNKAYNAEKYDEAAGAYGKALKKDSTNAKALFNLGAAQYGQKQYDKSAAQFRESINHLSSPAQKADAWYNLGNGLYKQQQLEQSINAYKEALRLNPAHENARYNLVMAKKKLQQQQQEQQNKQNKEQPQNNPPDKKPEDQQDKGKQDQPKNEPQKEQPKSGQSLQEKQLEQLLKAIDQEESKVQQKLYQNGEGKGSKKTTKDW